MSFPVAYIGIRSPDGALLVFVETADGREPLPLRLDLQNHSPSGYECSHGGSGPTQLALAILADHLKRWPEQAVATARSLLLDSDSPDAVAEATYQQFKFNKIATLPRDGWTIHDYDVSFWLGMQCGERLRRTGQT